MIRDEQATLEAQAKQSRGKIMLDRCFGLIVHRDDDQAIEPPPPRVMQALFGMDFHRHRKGRYTGRAKAKRNRDRIRRLQRNTWKGVHEKEKAA